MDYLNYSYSDDEKKKLDEDILAKNKALEDLIANQKLEENQIKDDYDSLGSRANRFLQVFGAGLKGENASQVAQSLSDRLDKRLQGAQARYKDQRDSAYTQYKDLLARREALNKAEYDRSRDQYKDEYDRLRDQAKDQQWEKEFGLRTKSQADQNAIAREQLGLQRNQAVEKRNQAIKQAEAENQKALKDKVDTNIEITGLFNAGTMKPTGGLRGGDNDTKGGKLDDVVMRLVQKRYGISPKDYQDFKKKNPDIIPSKDEDEKSIKIKLRNLGYNPVVKTTSPDPAGNQVVTFEDGSTVIYNAFQDKYVEVE